MEDWSRERDEASNVQGPFRDGSPLRDEVEPDDADDNNGEDEAELGPQRHSREVPERGLLPLFVIHGVSVVIRAWETQRVGPVGLETEASPQTPPTPAIHRQCAQRRRYPRGNGPDALGRGDSRVGRRDGWAR